MHVTMYNTIDQTFWILYFLCVFGFLTQNKVKNDKRQQTTKAFKQQKFKNILECKINKQTTLSHYIERIKAWICYNAYA